ncbi:sugar ABC transporter substrate-binding protein [Amycolatopsis sp. GM8]|uniref:sugar ABC transporter substrate-binding protein n=1 Tax=Amycolatopsis sp. GM8 TaxID=2896530 RepID=UPI001F372BDF|nr:substrate-binding domain-containing protein [Amycolatopsis sp. GM8]
MKRTWLVLLAVVTTAAVSACGNGSSGTGDQIAADAKDGSSPAAAVYDGPEATLPQSYGDLTKTAGTRCVIGYQNLSAQQHSLSAEAAGAQAEAARLGCQIIVLDDQLSPTIQVNNFNQLLSQDVSAIVVYPLVPSALQPNIDRAAARNVPVIAIQTPVGADQPSPAGYATSVLQGFDTAAYTRAKAVAAKKPGAKFVVQGLAQPVAALQYFAQRQKYWGERFGLHFLGEVDNQDDTSAAATTSMAGALARYPSIDAVFTYNDDSAAADATAIRAGGRRDILVAGFVGQSSAYEGIKNGRIFLTYQPDWQAIGALTVDAAYALATKQHLPLPRLTVVPGALVTSDNVNAQRPVG